ncbi:MAG TPA: CRISPR-associated endonuclease Cas1 [Pirellulales bacterium]|nr:CRISPR-associated endonuclease Cas1 [Pirellulales bacterium]
MINTNATPDYLPARMLNEFVYCPRLFYYEWVEGVFAHNRETVEGSLGHSKIDGQQDELAPADELDPAERIHSRSVTLSSDTHGLIAKLDLIEAEGGTVTPIDYKRGSPRLNADTDLPEVWDADRVQLAAQALVLRDNGYDCHEAIVYYVATKQRVRVPIDDALVAQTLRSLSYARAAAASDRIPLPLVDSPKCPRCSLVGICLPDETWACHGAATENNHSPQQMLFDAGSSNSIFANRSDVEPRRMVAARDELRPLYLNSQGLHVGKSGNVLKVKEKDKVVQEVRIGETCQINLFGNIQLSTQALQALCENEVPIAYFSMGGWFYGITQGLGVKNVYLRRDQFRLADEPSFCLRLARTLVSGKIRNQRTMLQRNHVEPPSGPIAFLKCMQEDAEHAKSLEELLGIEGSAARAYFENFSGMIKVDEAEGSSSRAKTEFSFDFLHRNRRPPRDPVNALLSLAYSVLAKDLTIVCQGVGFDAYLGFYHQPRFGRAALPLDLMEPFRPLIADSAVLSAINTRMVTPGDFIRTGQAVALTPAGRKSFFRAYEQRMDTLVTHPLFGYRVNYRRLLEIQTRLLARHLTGEISSYPVFVTR